MDSPEATAPPSEAQTNGGEATQAVARRPDRTPLSQRDPVQLAQHFANSGFFKDAADMSKAVVKIVAGEELGLGPMASMSGIHIIEGKPSLSANLLASQVKRSQAYDYIVREHTAEGCTIEFLQNGESIGKSEFTLADAQRAGIAGKGNFQRYPKAMLFARALSQGVRWYCPDVTAGSPAYVPEELGAEVTAGGEPLEGSADVEPQPSAESEVVEDAEVVDGLDPERVEKIVGGFKALRLSFHEIGIALGACGLDGLRANSAKAVQERVVSLTPEEADKLEVEIERQVQEDAS